MPSHIGNKSEDQQPGSRVSLGKITSVYGVKGWVKVYSHTDPMTNILDYAPWYLKLDGRWQTVKLAQGRTQGKGLVAKLVGCDDRDQARAYCGAEIFVDQQQLPELQGDEFYWHQLEGLTVITEQGDELGRVDYLIATGSNDVLVVKGMASSIDRRERLIPYLPDQVIKSIDLDSGCIRVDWDPEF